MDLYCLDICILCLMFWNKTHQIMLTFITLWLCCQWCASSIFFISYHLREESIQNNHKIIFWYDILFICEHICIRDYQTRWFFDRKKISCSTCVHLRQNSWYFFSSFPMNTKSVQQSLVFVLVTVWWASAYFIYIFLLFWRFFFPSDWFLWYIDTI